MATRTDAQVRAAAYALYSAECRRQGIQPVVLMDEAGWSEAAWSKVARAALDAADAATPTPTEDIREVMSTAERPFDVQGARDLFARWENGHATEAELAGGLHALIDALSTPPADDVRDRLVIRHVGGNTLGGTVEQVLSTHLAKGWSVESFEVRPRGTVTDAEVDAGGMVLFGRAPQTKYGRALVREVLQAAREVSRGD